MQIGISEKTTRAIGRTGLVMLLIFSLSPLQGGCESETEPEEEGIVSLLDSNNYAIDSALHIPTVETAPATDLDICWGDLAVDIQCHDMNSQTEIDNVSMVRFRNMTEEEVELRLSSGEMPQSAMDGYVDFNTDHTNTCTKLSAMSFFGTEIDIANEYIESEERIYLLLFATGITPGVGARMMTFIKPTSLSTNTTIHVSKGCGVLEFAADLSLLTPIAIPANGPWDVDWSGLTKDGQGNEMIFENIDGVMLGFYEGETVPSLQEKILDLKLIATSMWEIALNTGGRSANLAYAVKTDDSSLFSGFQGNGVWLLGLMCSMCQNPAPMFLTVLNPVAGEL